MKIQTAILFCLLLHSTIATNGQDRVIKINHTEWMIPDIKTFKFSPDDTVQVGQAVFIKKEQLSKFIPDGYYLPAVNDLLELIKELQGTANNTGGKTVDSAYLSQTFSFILGGIYFNRAKRLAGVGYMTSFYTATDTLWKFDTTGLQLAQVALHIYRNGNSTINVEPTYNKLKNGEMFCNLLVRRKQPKI